MNLERYFWCSAERVDQGGRPGHARRESITDLRCEKGHEMTAPRSSQILPPIETTPSLEPEYRPPPPLYRISHLAPACHDARRPTRHCTGANVGFKPVETMKLHVETAESRS